MLSVVFGAITGLVSLVLFQTLVVVLLRRAIARAKDTTRKDYKILSIPQSVDPAKTAPVAEIYGGYPIESTMWLNQILERVFTELREHQTVERVVVDKLNAEFAAVLKKTKLVNKLSVKNFTSGNRAPEIRNATLQSSSGDDHTDLNVELNVHYSGMMSLAVETTLQLPAVGLLSVSVKVLIREISGRILLRLFNPDPTRAQLVFKFAENPTLNIQVESTVGDRNRGLVEKAIRSLLKMTFNKVIVEPHFKSVTLRGQPVVEVKKVTKPGVIAHLHVKIVEARGLAGSDKTGFVDPYVRVRVQKSSRHTSKLHKNHDPVWNEAFSFDVTEVDPEVSLEVYDKDKITTKGECLGETSFHLSTVPTMTDNDFPIRLNRTLQKRVSGALVDSASTICYEIYVRRTSAGTTMHSVDDDSDAEINDEIDVIVGIPGCPKRPLTKPTCYVLGIHVLEGRRLHASDDNGFSDPYCKVTLGTATKKTAIIKKTLNPNWNHKMTFLVKNRQEKIVFEVFDWDLGKKDDFIGYVSIPIASLLSNTTMTHTLVLEKLKEDDEVEGEIVVKTVMEHVFEKDSHKYDSFYTSSDYTLPEDRVIYADEASNLSDDEDGDLPAASATKESGDQPSPNSDDMGNEWGMDETGSVASRASEMTTAGTKVSIEESGKKLYLFNGHKFIKQHKLTLKGCVICGDRITLLTSSFRCQLCHQSCHKKCHTNMTPCAHGNLSTLSTNSLSAADDSVPSTPVDSAHASPVRRPANTIS